MHTDVYMPVYTMDHEVGPWKMAFSHGSISLKLQFTKPWGPSLGVNQMWTKRNDHVAKVNVMIFFNMCSKRAILKENLKFDHSLVFIFSSPKNISLRNYHNNVFFAMGLLPLPLQNPLDHVNGQCRPWNMSFGNLELHDHYDFFISLV